MRAVTCKTNAATAKAAATVVATPAYQNFTDLKPYTTTLLCQLDKCEINLSEVYHGIVVSERVQETTTNRKGKVKVIPHAAPAEIISAKIQIGDVLHVKGIDKGTKAFQNCVSVVLGVHDPDKASKIVDLKIFTDNIQMTGPTSMDQAYEALGHARTLLHNLRTQGVKVANTSLEVLDTVQLQSIMMNINFTLPFQICRRKIKEHLHGKEGFTVVWEAGVSSNGVNVKYYLETLEQAKKDGRKKPRAITIIIFASGKCLLIGADPKMMHHVYDLFIGLIDKEKENVMLHLI